MVEIKRSKALVIPTQPALATFVFDCSAFVLSIPIFLKFNPALATFGKSTFSELGRIGFIALATPMLDIGLQVVFNQPVSYSGITQPYHLCHLSYRSAIRYKTSQFLFIHTLIIVCYCNFCENIVLPS